MIRSAKFQSTRPVRGGTLPFNGSNPIRGNFNPPAPCGAGLKFSPGTFNAMLFQSTRPVRGGTPLLGMCSRTQFPFQSTRPVRGGTFFKTSIALTITISIHPPRAGRDVGTPKFGAAAFNFNPPAPCGAGPPDCEDAFSEENFNPPAPCGAGLQDTLPLHSACHFNPPAPCGAGPGTLVSNKLEGSFQSTRPVRGGTGYRKQPQNQNSISIHPPRAGRDN